MSRLRIQVAFLLFFQVFVFSVVGPSISELKAEKSEISIVSLGSHCQVSVMLRNLGMRKFAGPLDWLLSLDLNGLIKLIEEDFSRMFNRTDMKINKLGSVLNTRYKLDFRHDWQSVPNFASELPSVKKKYIRRIERFINLPKIAERVVFVRAVFDEKLNCMNNMPYYTPQTTVITSREAQKLYNCLRRKFPKLKFILATFNLEKKEKIVLNNNIVEITCKKLITQTDKFFTILRDKDIFDALYKDDRPQK